VQSDEIRVGLLAYGAIGDEHNQAVNFTSGLRLAAVCDTNTDRLTAALKISPDAKTFTDASEMLRSGEIDLVVISTPPQSHFVWAKEALNQGLHVVLEKPMALTRDECDELMAIAGRLDRLLVVYQNRRYDLDFLTIKRLVEDGVIGDIFAVETFVGGYSRPCSFWHSDAEISGGAIFDWGSHFIDQILSLMKSPVEHVSGINHKRVWEHVTNADHAEVNITFSDGTQASFINSDIAAARKPKFYLLGTKGAIVGNWDTSQAGPVADFPALISLHLGGEEVKSVPFVSTEPYSFHQSLSRFFHQGVEMPIRADQSRDVVAIMQAAEESAVNRGIPVRPPLLRS
jgi:scyllo-inositol 2-dehydrogenase (NADP+)